MSFMFLLNPPEKGKNGKRMLGMKYPGKMGLPAKKKARPSKMHGGSRITALLRKELGLKEGETPVRHRVTFYRSPDSKKKLLMRSPQAVLRNRQRRKGVKSIMARRRARRNRKHARRSRRIAVKTNVRRHRRARKNAPARRHHRRAGRRSSRVRAIVLANRRTRVSHRRHARRNPGFLANPSAKSALSIVGKAAGMFGGYAVTRIATGYLWNFIGPKLPDSVKNQEKWVKPAVNLGVTLGLAYVAKKYIFKRKPEIANYILIGGMFSVVKDVVVNLLDVTGAAGSLPGPVAEGLHDYVPEPLGTEYTVEPVAGYVPEPLSDMDEGEVDRYKELY